MAKRGTLGDVVGMRFARLALLIACALAPVPVVAPRAASADEGQAERAATAVFAARRALAGTPKPAWFVIDACASDGPAPQAYCTGYIEGASLIWKRWSACVSADPAERDFCDGAEAAEARLAAFFASCADCSEETFAPEMTDEGARARAFAERLRRLPDEIAAVLGACPRTATGPSERFCAAYDLWAETEIIQYSMLYDRKFTDDPGALGRGDGAGDAALHLFVSVEMFELEPCVTSRTNAAAMRAALLDFVARYPDQKVGTSAVIALGRALNDGLCGASGKARPHMESCLIWDDEAGIFTARNRCEAAVSVQFMAAAHPEPMTGIVPEGGVFRTGLRREELASGWWIFTACPEGHVASVSFEAGNEAIRASRYGCVPSGAGGD